MNYILIPARLDSKRLPGKALLEINDKALIHYTYDNCRFSEQAHETIVVTSNDKITEYCLNNDINYLMSGPATNGTLRCADILQYLNNPTKVINVQLDYPKINPMVLDYIFTLLDMYEIVTPHYRGSITEVHSPDYVKLIKSIEGDIANWFSRQSRSYYIHIGVYGFRAHKLELLKNVKPTQEAMNENLEQLTWIQRGSEIKCFETEPTISINTQEDFDLFKFRKSVVL